MNRWNVYVEDGGNSRKFTDIFAATATEAKRHVYIAVNGRIPLDKMRAVATY